MLGIVVLSLIINWIAFKNKPPLPRAISTVCAAALLQFMFSIGSMLVQSRIYSQRGLEFNWDWTEFAMRWLFGVPLACGIVGAALWWHYKRSWIDDDE